jgi:hypothetical protein
MPGAAAAPEPSVSSVPGRQPESDTQAAPTPHEVELGAPGVAASAAAKAEPREPEPEPEPGHVSTPAAVCEPTHLLCPITHALFRDPVFVPGSGNTYDRAGLLRFWDGAAGRGGEKRDPLTNSPLLSHETTLFANWHVRREVQRFLDAHPGARH